MLHINFVDAEIIKDGTSFLVSDNTLTGTSLEVLSFIVGGIEQSQNFNDGIDGRSRLFQGSEDKYRKITLNVRANAEYLQRVAHLRDAVNDLFSGEYYIREMRIKASEVKYESPGEKSGNMDLGASEYVNGKQFKVTKVNAIEADDLLQSNFNVELETTDLPYAESIYTTLELHDSKYSSIPGKYGMVDDIDHNKVEYRFGLDRKTVDLSNNEFENGSLYLSNGQDADSNTNLVRTSNYINVLKDEHYELEYTDNNGLVSYVRIFQYDDSGNYLHSDVRTTDGLVSFAAVGSQIRLLIYPAGTSISVSEIGASVNLYLDTPASSTIFYVYNAGNVTVEPESMYLNIALGYVRTDSVFTIKNLTTGDVFEYRKKLSGRNIYLRGINITEGGSTPGFRNTNRQFISLAPGDNKIEVSGGHFNLISIDFNYHYK